MTPRIISLSGFRGHGKDTVGQILAQHAGYTCVSFADPLKRMVSIQFGWCPDQLAGVTPESRTWREQPDPYWSHKLGRPFTPRQALTEIGTDLIRSKFLDTQWCDLMEKRLSDIQTPIVITDARFPNELHMIKRMGGTTMWVKRQPLPKWYSQVCWLNSQPVWRRLLCKPFLRDLSQVHESEQAWVGWPFDHEIENTGSMEDLTQLVLAWHKHIT